MTVRGWCRTLRAGVFAAVCVLLAALGHVLMSGTPVPWWAMTAGAAGTGTAGWLLAGRERGRTLIVAVVAAAQAVLHETFALAQSLAPAVVPGQGGAAHALGSMDMSGMDMGDMGSMHMDTMGMGSMAHGVTGIHQAHGMTGMSGSASYGMVAAHLLAAVLCGLWLAYGERAFFRVLRMAAARLVAPLRMLLAGPAPLPRPLAGRHRATDAPTPTRLLLGCSLTSRAPPTGAAVV
ncbi:hypothetical protein OG426_40895 [Streptomyces canus]|uniref:hypothetical protein n=1 Tax=Streptomyces canus TaxID=58343 RepID=UPI00224F55D8|nr:hypothetical protein [Streptomyces canus]MCX4856158.1 hypothetical protein [Streptomyces canus]WSW38364.1 hypothetical protein OG426_40895 [Streptomyces canus]